MKLSKLSLNVFVDEIRDDMIPQLISRLNDLDMDCRLFCNFSFSKGSDFLFFKFSFVDPVHEFLMDIPLVSGIELNVSDYEYNPQEKNIHYKVRPALERCKKQIVITWDSVDIFEYRFAHLVSSVLTEITNGVCHNPLQNTWSTAENIVVTAWNEVKNYESSIPLKELYFSKIQSPDGPCNKKNSYSRVVKFEEKYLSFDYN